MKLKLVVVVGISRRRVEPDSGIGAARPPPIPPGGGIDARFHFLDDGFVVDGVFAVVAEEESEDDDDALEQGDRRVVQRQDQRV